MTNGKILLTTTLIWLATSVAAANPYPALSQPPQKPVALLKSVIVQGQALLASSFAQTLYVFDPDQAAAKPSCAGTCAEKCPPLILSDAEGKTLRAPYAVVARDNGLNQVTYQGRPVYTFFLDRVPGDIKGDGLGGVWHIIKLN